VFIPVYFFFFICQFIKTTFNFTVSIAIREQIAIENRN